MDRKRRDHREWILGTDKEFRAAFWECHKLLTESEDEIDSLRERFAKILRLREEYINALEGE